MADDATKPARKKIGRVRIGLNVAAQIILLLLFIGMINGLAMRHFKRWDFSRDQKYSLSDKTRRFLESMKGKARITVFFAPSTPITGDVNDLLTEYQYAAKGKIDVERIDPERNLSRAKELFEKYKVISGESLLVIDYEGRNKTVKASEMAEIDQSAMAFGEDPRVAAFKGEQAVTSALIDLVEGKKNTIGYIIGHKEPPLGKESPLALQSPMQPREPESPVSVLKTFIENENIKLQELNLFETNEIAADIRAVMIAGPQYDFSDREMKLLRDFWEKQGRILLLIDPSAKTPKLDAFLNELGVVVNDDRLMAFVRTGIQEIGLIRDVQAQFVGSGPVTQRLAGARGLFVGGTCSLTLQGERVRMANVRVEPLLQAEKGYFAETDYNSTNQEKLQADAQKVSPTPLVIGAAVEKGGSGDSRVQVNSSRLVVVSNATFIEDRALTEGQQALDFVSGATNWLLSREQLIGIAPKVPRTLMFSLTPEGLQQLRWLILVLIPLFPAVIGGAVWWRRRA